ncbi:MAG: tetratricopeptide repeat protein [Candidatus Aminicenantes bacterium]|nr:tetratricopeptide repeat protein [Candidatus Aminicenantes bacterium]
MKKKLKEQLKSDELAKLMNRVLAFLSNNRKELLAAAGAVTLVILVIIGIKYIQNLNARKQSEILGQILALEESLAENPENLAQLDALGGSGKFERMAYIKSATYSYEQGDVEKALETIQKVPDNKKDFVHYQAQDLKAQILMAQKNYDDALKILDAIEQENPSDYALDIILYRKAQLFAARNDIDQAIALYKRLQEDYPGSFFGYEAAQEVIKLEAKK